MNAVRKKCKMLARVNFLLIHIFLSVEVATHVGPSLAAAHMNYYEMISQISTFVYFVCRLRIATSLIKNSCITPID